MSEFIHQPYVPGETIAAIATPPGEGGIAIIRISGKNAIEVAEKVFSGPVKHYITHTVHFGVVWDENRKRIDEGLLLVFLGRRSYTGEDTVELQCHGGMIASKRVLEAVIHAGARLARPGEFTLKAFMNGKLDLTQAEAIQKLIGAKSEQAFIAADKQLEGALSKKIQGFQTALIAIAAILEAWVDFPEEGIEFASMEEICASLQSVITSMNSLIKTFHDGKRLSQGISLCIVGCPNVGKSSLMNALLKKERAIVTPIAGTTRDLLEDELTLQGLHFRLIDTAGIRDTTEVIEQEGIRRSHRAMEEADLILLVLDASQKLQTEHRLLLDKAPLKKTLVVGNKIDLPHAALPSLTFPHVVAISAKEKIGLDDLQQAVNCMVWSEGVPPKDEVLLTSLRHCEALVRAATGCKNSMEGLQQGISPEFLTFEIRQALMELGTIIGTNITEDILSSIFSQFCIGK